ncbi:hypothetical protein CIB48_g6013 [Xylaria polymorpha]|nr:hypothetical protein CIB48_g6013 [Xylaria polymorpha]
MVPKNAARASACTLLSGRSSHILGFRPQDRETITDRRENKTARLPRNSHGCLGHCTPPANPRGVETLATWRQPDLCDESTMPCTCVAQTRVNRDAPACRGVKRRFIIVIPVTIVHHGVLRSSVELEEQVPRMEVSALFDPQLGNPMLRLIDLLGTTQTCHCLSVLSCMSREDADFDNFSGAVASEPGTAGATCTYYQPPTSRVVRQHHPSYPSYLSQLTHEKDPAAESSVPSVLLPTDTDTVVAVCDQI